MRLYLKDIFTNKPLQEGLSFTPGMPKYSPFNTYFMKYNVCYQFMAPTTIKSLSVSL